MRSIIYKIIKQRLIIDIYSRGWRSLSLGISLGNNMRIRGRAVNFFIEIELIMIIFAIELRWGQGKVSKTYQRMF